METKNNFINSNNWNEEEEIDLLEMAFELLDHWKIISFITILCACATLVYNMFFITPMYQSTAELYMLDSSGIISSLTDIQIGNNLATDYIKIIQSRPVIDKVIGNLNLETDYENFSANLTVTNDTNTHILKLTVKDNDAKQAKTIVDELSNVSKTFLADKMGQKEPSILHYGYIENQKVSPSIKRNTLIGALVGFCATGVLVVASWLLNDTIRIEEDVEKKLGLSVIGTLPYDESRDEIKNKKNKKKNKKKKAGK